MLFPASQLHKPINFYKFYLPFEKYATILAIVKEAYMLWIAVKLAMFSEIEPPNPKFVRFLVNARVFLSN